MVLGMHEIAVTQQAGQKPPDLDVAVCLSQLVLCTGVSLGVWVLCCATVAGMGCCDGLGPSSSYGAALHLV